MAITSYGYTGAVNNVQWAELANVLGHYYVAQDASACRVTSVSTGTRTVRVATGSIAGHGILDKNGSTVDIALPNVTSGSKWFLIGANRVWQSTNATTFGYIEGTSARQIPTRPNNPGVEDFQPLALVRIQAGQTLPQEIIDLRVIGSNSGVLIAFDELVLNYIGTAPGTVVRIGTTVWTRTSTAGGSVSWVAEDFASRLSAMEQVVETTSLGSSATGWTTTGVGAIGRAQGAHRHLVFRIRRSGSAIPNGAADVDVFNVTNTLFRPTERVIAAGLYYTTSGSTLGCWCYLDPNGDIAIYDMNSPRDDLGARPANSPSLVVDFSFIKA